MEMSMDRSLQRVLDGTKWNIDGMRSFQKVLNGIKMELDGMG